MNSRSLVARIQAGDDTAFTELYQLVSAWPRHNVAKRSEFRDIEDAVHEIYLASLHGIRLGRIRDGEKLNGYINGISRNLSVDRIRQNLRDRRQCSISECHAVVRSSSPEELLIQQERESIARKALLALPRYEREILIRFYLDEQPRDAIRESMHLTANQFRLLKSRAKHRLGEIGMRISRRGERLRH